MRKIFNKENARGNALSALVRSLFSKIQPWGRSAPHGEGKHRGGRSGGGTQKMRVSKHAAINRPPPSEPAFPYTGKKRNRSARRKRRLRYVATIREAEKGH